MLKGKWKILICIALVTCVVFTASNNVFAAINEGYNIGAEVIDINLDNKLSTSPLLEAIGALIYALGSLMEKVLGYVFELITGANMFPWADMIIYNAVPFLDVNIFTATGGSLLAILYDFVAGTYYSLLTLASTFFGIAVMFSAVKLAITAIAEDKARYKKAIVDWILGLVMLWGIHFFISFVLYLNEQLVVVASDIVIEKLESASEVIEAIDDTTDENKTQVYNFLNSMLEGEVTVKDRVLKALKIILVVVGVVLVVISVAALTVFTGGAGAAALAALGVTTKIATFKFFCGVVFYLVAGMGAVAGSITISTLQKMGKNLIEIDGEYATKRKESIEDLAKELKKDKNREPGGKIENVTKSLYSKGTETTFTFYNTSGKKIQKKVKFNMVDVVAGLLKNDVYISGYGVPKGLTDGSDTFLAKWQDGFSFEEGCTYLATVYIDAMSLVEGCATNSDLCLDIDGEDDDRIMPIEYYSLVKYTFDNIPVEYRTDANYSKELHEIANVYVEVFNEYVLKNASAKAIIRNLASYFKETSWTIGTNGWKANKASVQSAIMYVLLVCYSVVFFISYTKRLFYVTILMLMAPIVVVFDFFLKFGK